MIIFIPQYGIIAAPYIYIIIHLGYLLISMNLMHQKILLNERFKWFFWNVFILLIIVNCVVYILHFIVDIVEGKIANLICIFMSLVITLIISFLIPPELRNETINQFKNLQKSTLFSKLKP